MTLSPLDPGWIVVDATTSWTAQSIGLTNPEYEFWRLDASGWQIVQPYSSAATYTWIPNEGDLGQHALQVWARASGSSVNYDAWVGTPFFAVLEFPPIEFQNRYVGHTEFPGFVGVPMGFGSSPPGGTWPLEFRFWRYDSGAWIVAQDYARSDDYTWTPGTRDVGIHAVQQWARSMGSSAAYDGWGTTGYFDVQCGPALRMTAYDDFYLSNRSPAASCGTGCPPSGTALAGSPMTVTAAVCGGTGPSEFQFWRTKVGVTGWSIVQDYSPSDVFSWTPGPADIGLYVLETRARRTGSSAAYEAYDSKMFSVMASGPDLSVAITSPPIRANAGQTIVVDDTVTNLGPAPSPASTNQYILDGVVIGSRAVPVLAPSATSSASVMLTLPSTPGAYYLRVENDCSPDLSVGNNRRTISVRILP